MPQSEMSVVAEAPALGAAAAVNAWLEPIDSQLMARYRSAYWRAWSVSLIIMVYGPAIFHTMMNTVHHHREVMLAVVGVLALLLAVYVTRKIFDRRRGTSLPVEE